MSRERENEPRKFPGSLVVRTLNSHCQGPKFNPWSENSDPTSCTAWTKRERERERQKENPQKKEILQLKNALTEMKISLDSFNSIFDQAEESVNLHIAQ